MKLGTIDNVKAFIAKCASKTHKETPAINPNVDIPNVYGPCIPDDDIDKPTPCVYRPPSWYDPNDDLDLNDPEGKPFINREYR